MILNSIYSESWRRDPKHLGFVLARYKFVAKMLKGYSSVAEVGAGDGLFSNIISHELPPGDPVFLFDLTPLDMRVEQYDVMKGPLPYRVDAIYTIDVFEHVGSSHLFFMHLMQSLGDHGVLIVGTPSLESQKYASELSRQGHINCISGEGLRILASRYFHHVFMFSQNDEVVHTGFMPMAHYLWAVCVEPIRVI